MRQVSITKPYDLRCCEMLFFVFCNFFYAKRVLVSTAIYLVWGIREKEACYYSYEGELLVCLEHLGHIILAHCVQQIDGFSRLSGPVSLIKNKKETADIEARTYIFIKVLIFFGWFTSLVI